MAMYQTNAMTNREIADRFGVSVSTLNRWIREAKDLTARSVSDKKAT